MSDGWRIRRRIADIAFLAALATAAAASALGASPAVPWLAGTYLVLTALAVVFPTVLVAQVAAGQFLAGGLLIGGEGFLLVAPLVAGVVATAELLAITARMATPLDYEPRRDLRRAGAAVLVAPAVFACVGAVRGGPGPTGLAAIGLASAACIGIAMLLVRDGARSGEERS